MITFKEKTILLFIVFFLIANVLIWQELFRVNNRTFKTTFFDVGQGDSIFIESSKGHLILIDGGPDSSVLEKITEEIPFYRRKIDLVVLTHPHTDHYMGLIDVIERYDVENILWTGVSTENIQFQRFEEAIEKSNADIHIAEFGQKIIIPTKKGNKYLEVLYPFENIMGFSFNDLNESSIVAKLIYNDVSFLFTGDICSSIENKLINKEIDLKTNVLKVAHHGSRHSTLEIFLEKSLPQLAVIQVGENSYGHPHNEVLSRIKKFGIRVLTTKENGNISVFSDGSNLLIKK